MEDGFTDATLRRPKTTPVSSASAPLPPVIIAPIFGAGGVVSGSASASPNVASAGNSYSPDLGGGSGAYGPGAGSASAGYPSPAYRTSSRPSAESPRPSTSSGRSGDALGYSQGIALAPTPSSSSSRPTLEIGTRNPVAKGWGKLKAVVKATGQFASGNTPTGSGTLSASTSIPNLRQRIRPNAADYDSDSDASDASDDEGQVKDTVLLKVWEDAGPTAQRKLFGSKDDVFEGKVDGGEGREWKLRYLMLTGLNTARPQLHKLRLSQPSDPTSGLVPVHSWMLSALRSLKLYSVPRSSFIAVLGPPKMDVGRLEMGKLAGLVGFEGDKEYVWVAENDVRRGEFLRKLWAAVPPDTKRKVRLEGTDSDFGLPPETKSEREREREARKERERERELLRSQSEVAEEKETVDVPESQPDLARAQTAPAAPNLKATPPSPISTAKELLHPSPLSARSSSLPGEFVSPNNLAPRSASLRAGNTPTSHPTPMALAPWDDPDAPPESYDFNLLLSAADRLLARQHLLPTSLPPDLDLILSSFDFRIGGDARELERRVQDEIDGLERGNAWALLHVHMEHESIGTAVARAAEALQRVEEEHLDPYARVLVGMGADVRAIEARNRTGGVVGDNMDKLLTETRRLLSKLRLPEGLLETLRTADLADPGGRERALGFAHALLKRMAGPWEGMDQMRAVREQRNDWAGAAAVFAARVGRQIAGEADRAVSFAATAGRVDKGAPKFPALAGALQGYRGLLNWVREADPRGHYEILGGYADRLAKIWDSEVKRWIGECKGTIGGRTGNYLFAPEVSTPPSPVTFSGGTNLSLGKTSTAIKDISAVLTRKTVEGLKDTSGTLLATLRKAKVDIPSSSTSSPRGSSDADRMGDYGDGTPGEEAAEQALSGLVPALVREQAFITDLFEMDGRNDAPEKAAKRDVKWQRRMAETMDRLVPSLLPELLALIDVAARKDPTSSLGILVVLEKHCTAVAGSAQRSPWMLSVLQKAMERARESFVTFCEQQAGIIEGTKLLTRKKLGILDFTRTFPVFADRIEALLALNPQAPLDPPPLSRQCAATAYDLLSRTIFDSLDNISRQVERMQRLEEDEGRRYGGKITGAAGEEDAVVVHVLHVQNMHHLNSELRFRKISALEPVVKRAKALYDYHLSAYTKVVVRRPLGRLQEFFDGVEEMVRNGGEKEVAFRQAYSKAVLRDLVKKYPGREIKKGLDALYRRVERNFESASSLLQVVWRNIQEDYIRKHALYEELISRCYTGSGIRLEFSVQDLLSYFSDLARQH